MTFVRQNIVRFLHGLKMTLRGFRQNLVVCRRMPFAFLIIAKKTTDKFTYQDEDSLLSSCMQLESPQLMPMTKKQKTKKKRTNQIQTAKFEKTNNRHSRVFLRFAKHLTADSSHVHQAY